MTDKYDRLNLSMLVFDRHNCTKESSKQWRLVRHDLDDALSSMIYIL